MPETGVTLGQLKTGSLVPLDQSSLMEIDIFILQLVGPWQTLAIRFIPSSDSLFHIGRFSESLN